MPAAQWIEWDGQRRTLSEWARHYGLSSGTLRFRLKSGWSLEEAMTSRKRRRRPSTEHKAVAAKKAAADAAREKHDVDRQLQDAIDREHAPPWERHPEPWDNVVVRDRRRVSRQSAGSPAPPPSKILPLPTVPVMAPRGTSVSHWRELVLGLQQLVRTTHDQAQELLRQCDAWLTQESKHETS